MPDFEYPEEDGVKPAGAPDVDAPGTVTPPVSATSSAAAPSEVEPAVIGPATAPTGTETFVVDPDAEPEYAEPQPAPPRRSARGALLVGARVVTGAIGIAVAIATVAAAGWLPLPTVSAKVPVASVTPVPADQLRVCAGPLLRLGNESGEGATTARSTGHPVLEIAASTGDVDRASLDSTDSSTGVTPFEVRLPPDVAHPESTPLLAASQSQTVASGDLRGFAAAECREASGDSWLVGGSTITGRTTLLTMSNPGSVIATVTLTIYTEAGAVTAAGTEGIVVPPGGQRILSLAAFAPDAVSPIVRVQSTGSQVVANLQQSVVRTLEPGGVDVVDTSTGPSKRTVIPGVILSSVEAVTAHTGDEGYADLSPVIRLFAPGDKAAKTAITISPETGTAKPTTVAVSLNAGTVSEVPLGAFPDGTYIVSVSSDVPVLAGVRASSIGASGGVDLAWFAAAPSFSDRALVAIADGPSPTLHLANPTDADAEVTVATGGADDIAVTVPAGGAVAMPVSGSTDYSIAGFDRLALAVSYRGDGALASFDVTPTGPTSRPITVYPQ